MLYCDCAAICYLLNSHHLGMHAARSEATITEIGDHFGNKVSLTFDVVPAIVIGDVSFYIFNYKVLNCIALYISIFLFLVSMFLCGKIRHILYIRTTCLCLSKAKSALDKVVPSPFPRLSCFEHHCMCVTSLKMQHNFIETWE